MGVVAGINTHAGLPYDSLNAIFTAVFVLVLTVSMLALMRKVPWIRRRMDRRTRSGGYEPAHAARDLRDGAVQID
jgi:hypothetical protein